MENEYPCEICGEALDYEPEFCCDGYQCGCGGEPAEPLICEACALEEKKECIIIAKGLDKDPGLTADNVEFDYTRGYIMAGQTVNDNIKAIITIETER